MAKKPTKASKAASAGQQKAAPAVQGGGVYDPALAAATAARLVASGLAAKQKPTDGGEAKARTETSAFARMKEQLQHPHLNVGPIKAGKSAQHALHPQALRQGSQPHAQGNFVKVQMPRKSGER